LQITLNLLVLGRERCVSEFEPSEIIRWNKMAYCWCQSFTCIIC